MSSFLTIKEAADRAEKAEITVRRFVQSIVKDQPRSAKRKLIHPTPAEVRTLKKQHKPFSWEIAEELIVQHFVEETTKGIEKKGKGVRDESVLQTLQMELKSKESQMKVKDTQIEALTEIVQSLNERVREGNVLLASLQKHLALPEAGKKKSWWKKLFQ